MLTAGVALILFGLCVLGLLYRQPSWVPVRARESVGLFLWFGGLVLLVLGGALVGYDGAVYLVKYCMR